MSSLVSRVILSPNSSTRTCITILTPSISSFRAGDITASLHLLKQVPLDRIGDHLRGHLADAQIVEMRLDRQPSEQVLRQRQLDDSLPAPVLHPQRKLRAMLRHRGLVARLLWRGGGSRAPGVRTDTGPRAGKPERGRAPAAPLRDPAPR